ncbi:uncharacterized protein LOC133711370 [Rosa rugosa]|uniref:uncharacterized protein LOC133711370 n=1 Tax=Rosa rugosa TaxID=74645 RepID=UPI002B406352|nr:uncharacterized protein LOC133711370 [Rosa rugosa]
MLDGLLGRGFGAKCKSLIKLTKTRIDVIRRKRNATQKFLKKDIADLLNHGLEINAFGRAEGLTVEVILSACYDFVERCCDLVLKHLSVMQKQSECPEDCKEAVASLMVAAARFSDLPELRDIRQLFQERYANSLDYCADQKFVENIASKPPTLEKKVQLMKDIALEYSIKWDSKAFEQMMSKPPAFIQDKPKTYGSFPVTDDKGKLSNGNGAVLKGDRHDHLSTERRLDPNGGHKLQNNKEVIALKKDELDDQTRHRPLGKEYKSLKGGEGSLKEKEGHGILFQERQEVAHRYEAREDAPSKPVRLGSSSRGKGAERHYEAENSVRKRDDPNTIPHVKPNVAGPPVKSDGKDSFAGKEEGTPKLKPFSNYGLPPPYVKSNVRAKDRKHEANFGHDCSQGTGISMDPAAYKRAFADNVLERVQLGRDHERRATAKVDSYDHENEYVHQDDIATNNVPKPRSSRRRPSRSRSSTNDAGNGEDIGAAMSKPRSRSRRRDESRRGLQLLFDDDHHHRKDDEERRIDELLLHYSTKPSNLEPGQSRRKSKSRHASRDKPAGEESEPTHLRSTSLPHEHSGPSETPKVFARAASFQPDGSNPARHVHPKLPDYEDLAAKFAALRGR